jgi:hypothetical protein
MDARNQARPDLSHHRPRRQSGGRHDLLQRARHPGALQPDRHHPGPGQPVPRRGHADHVERRPADADHRRRHLRSARHGGWRCMFVGEQHRALRAGEAFHAQLPRQLHAGDRHASCRASQARCRVEHQLLHERADDTGRPVDVRGRNLRARQVHRDARRDGHSHPDLEDGR